MTAPAGTGWAPPGWEVLERLGGGAHADVYRAVHRDRPGRVVALKRLRPAPDAEPAGSAFNGPALEDLEREAAILADLAHPAIAVLHEVLVEPDGIILVLALATGGSLAERLVRHRCLPWPDVVDLGARLAGGLAAAHDAGVVHRDVKPSNVLFGREDEPRLADFGLARVLAEPTSEVVAGTAGYVAPEVLDGGTPSPKADQWALGVVLWEALVGAPPFVGADDVAVARAVARGVHLPLRDLVDPATPDDLVVAVERAIASDPAGRFATCRDIESTLSGLVPAPGAPPTGSTATRPASTVPAGPRPGGRVSSGAGSVGTGPDDTVAQAAPGNLIIEPAGGSGAEPPADRGEEPADDHRRESPADRDHEPAADRGGEPPDPTVTWGPRPPRDDDEPPPSAPTWTARWASRIAVGMLVVVPLAVAGWAGTRLLPERPGAASTTGTAAAATPAPDAPAGSGRVDSTVAAGPGVDGTVDAPAGGDGTVDAAPGVDGRDDEAVDGAVTRRDWPGSSTALLADWRPRRAPAACAAGDRAVRRGNGDPRTVSVGKVRLADVDGSGCAVAITPATDDGDLAVDVAGPGPVAGRWRLGPAGASLVVGDWDGDGDDTPGLVEPDGRVWVYDDWTDQAARGIATLPPGPIAVVTDRAGRDHVVSARDLDRSGRAGGSG